MGILRRNRNSDTRYQAGAELDVQKDIFIKSVENAKEANNELKNVLVENGFTFKIFLATGGKTKSKGH